MAGIYIHIPFCKQKCYYCDFYSITNLKLKDELIKCLIIELELQKEYLGKEIISTIYFGGGTPSVLNVNEIEKIIWKIYKIFQVNKNPEITMEANPDDLNLNYIKQLSKTHINRLSIGIQSFFDKELKLMNRRHNADEAVKAVKYCQNEGFENISIDLIYGIPDMETDKWFINLNKSFELDIQHISAYHLTFEPKTVFKNWLEKGKIKPLNENTSIEQYNLLISETKKNGFINYEISNFGKKNHFSQHNIGYWTDKKYLGIGPSAHSYDKNTRHWNISNVSKYIQYLKNKELANETEKLTTKTRYNEYIMTSLRTMWGADIKIINEKFDIDILKKYQEINEKYLNTNKIIISNNKLILTDRGKIISDKIISEYFL